LSAVPDALATARASLRDMPRIHAETAVGQFTGTAALVRQEVPALLAQAPALGDRVEPARFRATLVVETGEPWVEDDWLGRTMTVGDATIRIGGPIPRCAVIDHHPETGEKDVRLLKALAGMRPTNTAGEPMFGVYATVIEPGTVTVTR
jgi:uncharacterized protein YcbX